MIQDSRPPEATRASHRSTLRIAFALLLVASAALFAVGIHTERSTHHETTTEATHAAPAGHTESGESGGEASGETPTTAVESSGTHAEASERVLGINTETDTVVNVVVIVSLLLAAGIVFATRYRALVLVAVGFCLGTGIFDVAEIAHQISRSEHGLALLAAAVALAHLAAAGVGVGVHRETA